MTNDANKTRVLADLLEDFINQNISLVEARLRASEIGSITAEELALAEEELSVRGISDDTVYNNIEYFLDIFKDTLTAAELDLPDWHPVRSYQRENEAVFRLLKESESYSRERFIPNEWASLMDQLKEYKVHLARKQNQLYPALERKNFDRPSKIMWTLDDKVQTELSRADALLKSGQHSDFLDSFDQLTKLLNDLIEKENNVLFPTAVEMITIPEFKEMRAGGDEIGYALISAPPQSDTEAPAVDGAAAVADTPAGFMNELKTLLEKYNMAASTEELDVRQGKMTLEQINLMFRHLPVDLSFVDENDIVKFYSDTRHRVFPRSPGAIGRYVTNCHPRESLGKVMEIIDAFRDGSKDEAEFWLEMGGKFIYILYTAVRDDDGRFRGVLEMMQDVTHIRSLQGNQRLVSWKNDVKADTESASGHAFTSDTKIGEVIEVYPGLRKWLPTISPKYSKLANPVIFKTMAGIATLDDVAARGGFTVGELLSKIDNWIEEQN